MAVKRTPLNFIEMLFLEVWRIGLPGLGTAQARGTGRKWYMRYAVALGIKSLESFLEELKGCTALAAKRRIACRKRARPRQ